jgi:hypothetical protein
VCVFACLPACCAVNKNCFKKKEAAKKKKLYLCACERIAISFFFLFCFGLQLGVGFVFDCGWSKKCGCEFIGFVVKKIPKKNPEKKIGPILTAKEKKKIPNPPKLLRSTLK